MISLPCTKLDAEPQFDNLLSKSFTPIQLKELSLLRVLGDITLKFATNLINSTHLGRSPQDHIITKRVRLAGSPLQNKMIEVMHINK